MVTKKEIKVNRKSPEFDSDYSEEEFCMSFLLDSKSKKIKKTRNLTKEKITETFTFRLRRQKGYAYTMESMLGIALVIIFMVIIFTTVQAPVSANTALIRREGFDALEFLEQNDELRSYAFAGDETTLKKRLRDLLPPAIALEADVCTAVCEGNLPQGKTVVSIEYYVSGYRDAYFTKKIKLWMWGSF